MPGVVFLIVVPTSNFERQLLNNVQFAKNDLYTSYASPPPLPTAAQATAASFPLHHGSNLPAAATAGDNNAVLRLEVELRDKNTRNPHTHSQHQHQRQDKQMKKKFPQLDYTKNDINFLIPMEKMYNYTSIVQREIVTGDEKWIHYDNLKHRGTYGYPGHASSSTTAPNIHGQKIMLWWNQLGVVYFELLKPNETITGEVYRRQLMRLSRALKVKRPEMPCALQVLEELLVKLEIDQVTWSTDRKGNYNHVVFPLQAGDPCETTLHCLTELGIGINFGSSVSVLPCSVTYDALRNSPIDEDYSDEEEFSKWQTFVESIKSKLTVKQVVDGVRAGGSLSFDYLLLIVTADSLAALGLVENNAPNITAAMLVSPLMGPVMSITFGAIISDRELMKSGFISLSLGMFISLLFGFIFGLILGSTEMPWGFNDWPTEEMKGRGNARSLWMGVLWALTSGTGVAVALLQGAVGPLIGVAISASLLPPVVNCGLYWSLSCIWLLYDGVKIPHLKGESYTGNSSYQPLYTTYMPTEFLVSGIVSGMLTVINVICIFITAIIVLKIKEVAAPYTSSPDLRRFWETDIRTVRKNNRSTMRRKNIGGGGNGSRMTTYDDINDLNGKNIETALELALREAVDDETLRKVKRMSYSGNAIDELTQRLGLTGNASGTGSPSAAAATTNSGMSSLRNSRLGVDLNVLDKLVTSILERQQQRINSPKLNRLKSLTRSQRNKQHGTSSGSTTGIGGVISGNGSDISGDSSVGRNGLATSTMPTIMETRQSGSSGGGGGGGRRTIASWTECTTSNNNSVPGVRQIINTIANAPHRFSHGGNRDDDEENTNLTHNMLD